MDLNRAFWQGKRVLVTGHTGFKGSWLCLVLSRLGAQVCGYALAPPTSPSLFEAARVAGLVESIPGDVRDLAQLTDVVHRFRPEIVVHMAAQALVRKSYRDPVETYATNVMGTVHLLEAVRHEGGARVVINVTSDKCYENREQARDFLETDPMGGSDPYSSSKGCAELVTEAYRRSFLQPSPQNLRPTALASARAGNVIGGGDWAEDRLIPDCLRACQRGESIAIRNPSAVRPWQHVLEPVCAYLQLAQRLWARPVAHAEGWNFGPRAEDALPVQNIVERLTQLWGPGAAWHVTSTDALHEARILKLDTSKSRTRLRWAPRITLDLALEWVVDWHKRYQRGDDPHAVSLNQIDLFLAKEKCSRWTHGADFAKAG